MNRGTRIALLTLLALSLNSCADWNAVEENAVGHFDNTSDTFLVIRSSEAWAFLYHWTRGPYVFSTVPLVDFPKEIVLAALLGDRTGLYRDFFFQSMTNTGNLQAHLYEEIPPGISVPLTSRPYAFASAVATPSTDVEFFVNNIPVDSNEFSFQALVQRDMEHRSNLQATPFPAAQLASLDGKTCPTDQSTLSFVLFAGKGSVVEGAYFCPDHGEYWTRKWDTKATSATGAEWFGPFFPGKY